MKYLKAKQLISPEDEELKSSLLRYIALPKQDIIPLEQPGEEAISPSRRKALRTIRLIQNAYQFGHSPREVLRAYQERTEQPHDSLAFLYDPAEWQKEQMVDVVAPRLGSLATDYASVEPLWPEDIVH